MAERMLAGRWSPAKSVTKRALTNAAAATEITPRPNWRHASHEELVAALAEPLLESGVVITARLDRPATAGGQALYQTTARWGVRRAGNDAPPGYFGWNAQSGQFRANFPGPRYAAARAAVEEAVRLAEENASVRREDIRNQLALAVMESAAVAPFAPLAHIEPKLEVWVMGQDVAEFARARRFLQLAGFPLRDLSELAGPPGGFRAAIRLSLGSAERRYGTRSGWLAIAKASHERLLEAVE